MKKFLGAVRKGSPETVGFAVIGVLGWSERGGARRALEVFREFVAEGPKDSGVRVQEEA